MNTADAALRRIQKLLALAADQHGTPEGEAASRLARKLLARFDLDETDLREAGIDPIVRRAFPLDGTVLWRRRLASAVARHCECALTWSAAEGQAWIYGRRSGIAVADYLHEVLVRELEAARAEQEARVPPLIPVAERRRRLADFTGSAVLAVEHRLSALRNDEASAAFPYALLRRRRDELRDWMKENGLRFRPAPPSVFGYHPEGYALGHAIALRDALGGQG